MRNDTKSDRQENHSLKRQRMGPIMTGFRSFLMGLFLFKFLNSVRWTLIGGLGYGAGVSVVKIFDLPLPANVAGAVGLMIVLQFLLTSGHGKVSDSGFIAVMGVVMVSSAVFAYTSLSPSGANKATHLAVAGAACAGFFATPLTCIVRLTLPSLSARAAFAISLTAAALFTGIGYLGGGLIGWAIAGGVSLCAVYVLSECLRTQPRHEVDGDGQYIREIPRGEMARSTLRKMWNWKTSSIDYWGWDGCLAGLFGALWAEWATARKVEVLPPPVLLPASCLLLMLFARLHGWLKYPAKK